MTTTAQVKKLIKPLLASHPDLALVGRKLVVRPVHHVLKAILLDRTRSADHFRPIWFVYGLFQLRGTAHISWGDDIYHPQRRLWQHADDDIQTHFFAKIEQDALPKLRAVKSIADLASVISTTKAGPILSDTSGWFEEKLLFEVALGNVNKARTVCAQKIDSRDAETYGRDEDDRAMMRRMKQLCSCVAADDRAGIAELLHTWEAQMVRHLKLDHLWEPTPFPLELRA